MIRRLKQFLYLCLFAAFWAGVAGLFYLAFFKAPVSCMDGKQNQGEEGVDCGGPCRAFCLPQSLVPPSPLGTPQVFQPTPTLLAVLAELKNPNATAGATEVPYAITVSGAAGTPLTVGGVTSLYPGEVRRLVLVRPTGSLKGPLSARLAVATSTLRWAVAAQFPRPMLDIVDAVTTDSPDGVRVEGVLASNDALTVTDIAVVALFYDAGGRLLGASQTAIERLIPRTAVPFTISYPPLPGIDPAATQITATGNRP